MKLHNILQTFDNKGNSVFWAGLPGKQTEKHPHNFKVTKCDLNFIQRIFITAVLLTLYKTLFGLFSRVEMWRDNVGQPICFRSFRISVPQ